MSTMQVRREIRSPNYDQVVIPVEFVVLHYTASSLADALVLLTDRARGTSCHLVIDETGAIFELVKCLDGEPYRAAHAGASRYFLDGELWSAFNDFSIGIELVNLNGNLFHYTLEQYASLAGVVSELRQLFPKLRDPRRVVGHEQIAGWRGKADPGWCFLWRHFYNDCYPQDDAPPRGPSCPAEVRAALEQLASMMPANRLEAARFWTAVSTVTEAATALAYQMRQGNAHDS